MRLRESKWCNVILRETVDMNAENARGNGDRRDDDDGNVNDVGLEMDNMAEMIAETNNDEVSSDKVEQDVDVEESKVNRQDSNRIWSGKICVHGNRNEMWVQCVAIRSKFADKPDVKEASLWPKELICGAKDLKDMENVLDDLCDSKAQWYVRFVSVNEDGEIINCDLLRQVGKMMQMKKMVFAIKTSVDNKWSGTLYLLGMQFMSDGEDCIAGVFCPV